MTTSSALHDDCFRYDFLGEEIVESILAGPANSHSDAIPVDNVFAVVSIDMISVTVNSDQVKVHTQLCSRTPRIAQVRTTRLHLTQLFDP